MTFKEISVPFDSDGNMCHSTWPTHTLREFKAPIEEDLQFKVMYQNSSGIVQFVSNRINTTYWMNNSEFQRIVPFMVNGRLKGNFTFTRHAGKYFSLKYLND